MAATKTIAKSVAAAAICLAWAGAVEAADTHARQTTCATCHREEATSFPHAPMGIGMELPPNQQLLKDHPKLTAEANGYSYEVERKGDASTYTVKDSSGALSLPIKYAFGVRNETFVFEYQDRFYESMMSYYESVNGLAVTMGSERLRPHNLVEAMGRLVSEQEITACFNCHGTGGVTAEKLTLNSLKPGLDCDHCHAGATAHMQSLTGGQPAPVPKKLGDMAAEEMSEFCGQCHRTWATVVGQRIFGEKNVRFQPYRLANSKCFLGDDKRIRCTACHEPHHDLVREEASYDKACLACHSLKGAPVSATATAAMQKACPVADKNCVSCHMPKVRAPGSGSVFNDHDIRVVHTGDPYPY
jgi:hypothetical protein